MAERWAKFDANMDQNPRFLAYMEMSGSQGKQLANEAYFTRLIRAWALTEDGRIDLNKPGDIALLKGKVGLSGQRLKEWLELLAEAGLISAAGLELGFVGSERSMKDARTRTRMSDGGKAAAEARWSGTRRRKASERG